jgi:hypothetical protein
MGTDNKLPNEKIVVEHINARIKWLSGGDEMKSMVESFTDRALVGELNKILELINQ